MKLNKTDTITIRVTPALKRKFEVAKGLLNASDVLGYMMQQYVRDFEKQYGIIPVSLDKKDQYDIITKIFGVNITRARFDELHDIYPKTRKDVALYGK